MTNPAAGPASISRASRRHPEGPRTTACADRRRPGVVPLARRRQRLHRRLHGPGQLQHHAGAPPEARIRIQREPEHRKLGCRRVSAGDGGVPAGVRPSRRHGRAQASVHRRLPAVRAELGAVRTCTRPAGAHRASACCKGSAPRCSRRAVSPSWWRRPGSGMRGRALGIQAAAQAIGLSAGPAIGGLILETLDWRWVFFVNVPVGLAGTVMAWFVLPTTRNAPDEHPLRLEGRAADRPCARGRDGGAERRTRIGGDLAAHARPGAAGGDPADPVHSHRAARRGAADRPQAVRPARVLGSQCRRPPVLRSAVRTLLPDALHLPARVWGFRSSPRDCGSASFR